MSRTDNTMPWRLREEYYREDYLYSKEWLRILNTRLNGWGRREVRRYWHSERAKTRRALENGWEVEPSRPRHSVRWDMW